MDKIKSETEHNQLKLQEDSYKEQFLKLGKSLMLISFEF